MDTRRLEGFSDGVLAIIITITVLEMKVPHDADFTALWPLWPVFLSYILSFVYIGIYWNNHHHLLHASRRVNGAIMWANSHLLFWLSLIPFATGWMGENHFAPAPTGLYGVVLLMASIAYWMLQRALIREHGNEWVVSKAVGYDLKGKLSPVIYLVAIISTFFHTWIAQALYVLVAVMWLVPDTRIERIVSEAEGR